MPAALRLRAIRSGQPPLGRGDALLDALSACDRQPPAGIGLAALFPWNFPEETMQRIALLALATFAGALAAQSNTVAGLDGRLTAVSNITVLGSTATTVGCAAQNDMCNPGTVQIPWQTAMAENHPKFGFLICRELNGRFEQVSDRSFVKHAFTSVNGSGGCG